MTTTTRDLPVTTTEPSGPSTSSARRPSTRNLGPSGVGYPGAPRVDSAGRGRLVMAAKVVQKITAQAASEVSDIGGSTGGVLGIGARSDLQARPKVSVELSGRSATADIAVAIGYPSPIREVTERTRRHVVDQVRRLTGVEMTRIDITVTGVHRGVPSGASAGSSAEPTRIRATSASPTRTDSTRTEEQR